MKLNSILLRSAVVAALGGLLFGFDTAVISGATHALEAAYSLSSWRLGFTVTSALIGTVLGAMFAGIPGDRIGRRDSLRITAVLYFISAMGCALAWDWYSLVFFRVIGGLGIGASSVLGPMYIAEMAPAKQRGRLVGLFQFNVVSGILLAYLSNYLIGQAGLGAAEWRWKLGIAALPAVLFFAMLFGIPRSPRWLAQKTGAPKPGTCFRRLERRTRMARFGKSPPPSTLSASTAAPRCSSGDTGCPCSSRLPSACSISSPASTPSSIT